MEIIECNINYDDYSFCEQEGTFKATLDYKRWGKKRNVVAYFTFKDGRKILTAAWWNQDYLGLCELPIGATVNLTFSKKRKNTCYLRKVEVV